MPKKKTCCDTPHFTHVITKQKIPVSKLEANNGSWSGVNYRIVEEEHEIVIIYCTNCGTKKED